MSHPIDPALLPHHLQPLHHNQHDYASYIAGQAQPPSSPSAAPSPPTSAANPNAGAGPSTTGSNSGGVGGPSSNAAGGGGGAGGGGMYDLPPPTQAPDDPSSIVDVVGLQSLSDAGFHLGSHHHSLSHLPMHHHHHHSQLELDGAGNSGANGGGGGGGQQLDPDDSQHGDDGGSMKDDSGLADGSGRGGGTKKRKRAPNGQGVRTIARKQAEESATYINSTIGRATAFKNGIATIEHNMRLLETKTGAMIFYVAALPDEPPHSSTTPQHYISHTSPSLLTPIPPNFYVHPSGSPLYPGQLDPPQPAEAAGNALATMLEAIGPLQARWRAHHPGEPERKKGRPTIGGVGGGVPGVGGSGGNVHHEPSGAGAGGDTLDPSLADDGAVDHSPSAHQAIDNNQHDGEQYLNHHHHMTQQQQHHHHPHAPSSSSAAATAAAVAQHELQQHLHQYSQQQHHHQAGNASGAGGGGGSGGPGSHEADQQALDDALLLGGHPSASFPSAGGGGAPPGANEDDNVSSAVGGPGSSLALELAQLARERDELERLRSAIQRERDEIDRLRGATASSGGAAGGEPSGDAGAGSGGPGGGVDDGVLDLHHAGGVEADDDFTLKMD